ncbi:SRPBCC family protein [Tenacibaculum amylolyticum]|uniref:SRPBCC family protein n=1 Tax=Tenacibaculum amylolyticum TaxID=104269 RepID=UPI0038932CDA
MNKSNSIYHNVPINASVEKVFKAISAPEELEKWWPQKCIGIPELGAVYNFYFGEAYNWYGEVIEYKENVSFYIKMTKSDKDWNPTTFGFDLQMKGGETYLQFFHKDWPEINTHFKHSSFCWAMLLNGLKNYLEKGIIIPFSKRE